MSKLYRNEVYEVVIKDVEFNDKTYKGYAVHNHTTGIDEFETRLLPEAIHYSIELKNDLDKLDDLVKADSVTEAVTH